MMTLKRIALGGAVLALPFLKTQAALPLYENFGNPAAVPQVDATVFANYGSFIVAGILPYETLNTLHYTNLGRMVAIPGFRFEFNPVVGFRRPAESFFNGVDARIFATSGGRFLPGVALTNFGSSFENAQIFIEATSLTNKGTIHSDARGLVHLKGKFVDLERSSVGILPFNGGQGLITPTNFIPDVGVFDRYWGMDSGQNQGFPGPPILPTDALVQAVPRTTNYAVTTPPHLVTNELFPDGFVTGLNLTNARGWVRTNAVTPTNWLIQAVFVQRVDTNLMVDVKFTPSTIPTNFYRTAIVEFSKTETNVLDGGNFTNQVYLIDRTASETNFVLLTNLTTLTTYMPSTYEVTRATPRGFANGLRPNATNAVPLVYSATYSNTIVTNLYSAYGFNITNVAAVIPNVPGASMTNAPGRVEIDADDLNLNRTRIRGEGIVAINARNISGSNSVVDVQNLSFDLASASGNLLVRGLAKDTIERTTGDVFAWTAMWTNQTGVLVTNTIPSPGDPTTTTNEVVTNVVDIGIHVLVLDSAKVSTRQQVFTANFKARSRSMTLADTLRIQETLRVDSENLTLTGTGRMLIGANIPDWDASNFPNLRNLTNAGTISLSGTANFGTPGGRPYQNIVNGGTILAFNQLLRADYVENGGKLQSVDRVAPPFGTITIEANSAKIERGILEAGGEIRIGANDLKLSNAAITNRQAFTLSVTNSLLDAGTPTNSVISTEGFHFLTKPERGGLLGTKIESIAPRFLAIPHLSAATDLGNTNAGYKDNLAIGRLALMGDFDSLFSFRGIDNAQNYALYVDFLELGDTVKADVRNSIHIAQNMVVYFADSNVPVEQLNGLFADAGAPQGRLQWVSGFAGPNSSIDVIVRAADGRTNSFAMNRALRDSVTEDTDRDGIVNKLDPFPIDPPPSAGGQGLLTGSGRVAFNMESSEFSLAWEAGAGASYVVESTADLTAPNWQVLTRYTNPEKTARSAVFRDPIPPGASQRYYRVRPAP